MWWDFLDSGPKRQTISSYLTGNVSVRKTNHKPSITWNLARCLVVGVHQSLLWVIVTPMDCPGLVPTMDWQWNPSGKLRLLLRVGFLCIDTMVWWRILFYPLNKTSVTHFWDELMICFDVGVIDVDTFLAETMKQQVSMSILGILLSFM